MSQIIHTMIRVFNLERSISFYTKALGLEVAGQFEFDSFTLTYLKDPLSDHEIELTSNHNRKKPYEHGEAYGHIAVCVDDIEETYQRLVELGLQPTPIKSMEHNNKLMATFFFLTDPDGYKIEFLHKVGRFQ